MGASLGGGGSQAARLRDYVREIADFPTPGIGFKDITPLLADRGAFGTAIEELLAASRPGEWDKVCGIEARGFILGGALAARAHTGFIPIRKFGKLPFSTVSEAYALEYAEAVLEAHSDAVQPGDRVLIVDDVLATGGTAGAAARLIERLGAQVVRIAVLIELEFLNPRELLARSGSYDVVSLIRYP